MNAQLLLHVCDILNAVQLPANIDMLQTASLVRCLHCTLDTMLPLAFLLARCSAATAGYYLVYWPVFGTLDTLANTGHAGSNHASNTICRQQRFANMIVLGSSSETPSYGMCALTVGMIIDH
jgi:hypothetical protein